MDRLINALKIMLNHLKMLSLNQIQDRVLFKLKQANKTNQPLKELEENVDGDSKPGAVMA